MLSLCRQTTVKQYVPDLSMRGHKNDDFSILKAVSDIFVAQMMEFVYDGLETLLEKKTESNTCECQCSAVGA